MRRPSRQLLPLVAPLLPSKLKTSNSALLMYQPRPMKGIIPARNTPSPISDPYNGYYGSSEHPHSNWNMGAGTRRVIAAQLIRRRRLHLSTRRCTQLTHQRRVRQCTHQRRVRRCTIKLRACRCSHQCTHHPWVHQCSLQRIHQRQVRRRTRKPRVRHWVGLAIILATGPHILTPTATIYPLVDRRTIVPKTMRHPEHGNPAQAS